MSSVNKFMEWLGLVDESEAPHETRRDDRLSGGGARRPDQRPRVRTVPPEAGVPSDRRDVDEAAPLHRRPYSTSAPDLSVVVRPGNQAGSMVGYTETIEAAGFDDAKRIADLLRERIPVLINLRSTDPVMVRRLVDFSSGLVYALDGSIRKVSEGVLLVSPPRVKILDRELRRLSELGLYDLDA